MIDTMDDQGLVESIEYPNSSGYGVDGLKIATRKDTYQSEMT